MNRLSVSFSIIDDSNFSFTIYEQSIQNLQNNSRIEEVIFKAANDVHIGICDNTAVYRHGETVYIYLRGKFDIDSIVPTTYTLRYVGGEARRIVGSCKEALIEFCQQYDIELYFNGTITYNPAVHTFWS